MLDFEVERRREHVPHVKQASNAKTKTTAAIPDADVLMATQMASATRTRHMPIAFEMKSLRRPTRSMVHHCEGVSMGLEMKLMGIYSQERCNDVEKLEETSKKE